MAVCLFGTMLLFLDDRDQENTINSLQAKVKTLEFIIEPITSEETSADKQRKPGCSKTDVTAAAAAVRNSNPHTTATTTTTTRACRTTTTKNTTRLFAGSNSSGSENEESFLFGLFLLVAVVVAVWYFGFPSSFVWRCFKCLVFCCDRIFQVLFQ